MLTLAAKKRDKKDKPDVLRASGVLPAVVYGRKSASMPISVSSAEFQKVWKEAGYSSVVSLKGISGDIETLIYDLSINPITGKPMHADFYVIEKGRKVEVTVPLVFEGVAPAEKLGATILRVMHEIEIKAEAHAIPHDIKVDLAPLADIGVHITAGQVILPAGVELVTDADEIVVSAAAFKEEVVEPTPAPAAAAEAAPAEGALPAEGAPAPAQGKKEEKK